MIRLERNLDDSIAVHEMKDGDIGVITSWKDNGLNSDCVGWVVQRYDGVLLTIGREAGCSWYNLFGSNENTNDRRVRLLKNGDVLIYENNE